MGGYPKVPFRRKAAHPVSNRPCSSTPPAAAAASERDGDAIKSPESKENASESISDGPDTSSFPAFPLSLSSSESVSHCSKLDKEKNEKVDTIPASTIKGNRGRKSLIERGKKSVSKVINKAAKIGGHRSHKLEQKADGGVLHDSSSVGYELTPRNDRNEVSSQVELPDISEPSALLSESLRHSLYVSLPLQDKGKNWVLLYSTWRHGVSLANLYRRSELCPGHNLLIVGDQKGAIFGGLLDAPLLLSKENKYQGTTDTFVFTSLPSHPIIYRPTGANRYFTLCSTEYLAMGGGGHFALYLQEDLLSGSSSTSDTYGNPCLAHTQDFKIKDVELWGFVYTSKYEETLELCRTEVSGICRW